MLHGAVSLYNGDVHIVNLGICYIESDSGLRANSTWNVAYNWARWTALQSFDSHTDYGEGVKHVQCFQKNYFKK